MQEGSIILEKHIKGTSTSPGRVLKIICPVDVRVACDRSESTRVKHFMKLEYLNFELPDCVNEVEHRGHFVHRVIVCVKPTEEWRTKINRLIALPSDDSDKIGITVQEGSSTGLTGAVNSAGVFQGSASYTKSKGLSEEVYLHGWALADADGHSGPKPWSVQWTWDLYRWKKGRAFEAGKPWKSSSGSLPEIPYGKPNIRPVKLSITEAQENLAEWWSSPGSEKMEWDVEVQFCTACLKKGKRSLTSGLKYTYEWDVLSPGKITRICERITGV